MEGDTRQPVHAMCVCAAMNNTTKWHASNEHICGPPNASKNIRTHTQTHHVVLVCHRFEGKHVYLLDHQHSPASRHAQPSLCAHVFSLTCFRYRTVLPAKRRPLQAPQMPGPFVRVFACVRGKVDAPRSATPTCVFVPCNLAPLYYSFPQLCLRVSLSWHCTRCACACVDFL